MNGAYQIINFDDIEFTTGTAELVVGAYKKITDTAKRFVITHLNLDDEVYKDIQLTFENVEGTFVGTGVVNGKLAVVSIASTDQVTISLNDIAGDITSLENQISLLNTKVNDATMYKAGDTISFSDRAIVFGNSGGTGFQFRLFMPKIFTESKNFELTDRSDNVRVGNTTYNINYIYVTAVANTNIINVFLNPKTPTGVNFETGLFVPSAAITIEI